MHSTNWDDLRYVLAVAENGSVAAASRVLGVNHATVLRRIAAFEDRHGGPVFDRTVKGYSVSEDSAALIDAARAVERAMLAVDRVIEGAQAPLTGTVRITSSDSLCCSVMAPVLAKIRRDAPGLRLELRSSNAHLDLARMQSDITVRPAETLPPELKGIRAADLGFGVFAAPGAPPVWLAPVQDLMRSPAGRWVAETVPETEIAGAADSFVSLREMAGAGMGRAILPAVLGEADDRLERLEGLAPAMSVPLWVATHADLAGAPRIAVVRDRLAEALDAHAVALLGERGGF